VLPLYMSVFPFFPFHMRHGRERIEKREDDQETGDLSPPTKKMKKSSPKGSPVVGTIVSYGLIFATRNGWMFVNGIQRGMSLCEFVWVCVGLCGFFVCITPYFIPKHCNLFIQTSSVSFIQ